MANTPTWRPMPGVPENPPYDEKKGGGPGQGMAYWAGRILELEQQKREAALRGDWDKVDEIQKEIDEISRYIDLTPDKLPEK